MKKILTVCILLIWVLFPQKMFAQGTPKIPIIELFSSTHCAYCPAAEDALSKSYDSSNGKFIYVVYHSNDEFTAPGVSNRISYYGIFGTPMAEVEGTYRFIGSTDISNKGIDRAILDSSGYSKVDIGFTNISFDTNSISFDTNVKGDVKENLSIYYMLVEDYAKITMESAKTYRFVVRLIDSVDGVILPYSGAFGFNNISSFNSDNLYLVLFAQNKKTMEIYQAKEIRLKQNFVPPVILNSEHIFNSLPFKIYIESNYSETFQVQVSRDSNFNNILIEKELTGSIFEINKGDLVKGQYYLRVRAKNSSNFSDWSNVFNFSFKALKDIVLQVGNPFMDVNGEKIEIDPGRGTTPIIVKEWGRTVIPIRAIVEVLGGSMSWDGTQRKVTIKFTNINVDLWIDNPKAKVNGKEVWIDSDNHNVEPIIQNSRTMLPLRFIAESLDCAVSWDSTTQTITLSYPD